MGVEEGGSQSLLYRIQWIHTTHGGAGGGGAASGLW